MLTKREVEKIIRLYQKGLTVSRTAMLLGHPRRTVTKYLKRAGVSIDPNRKPIRVKDFPIHKKSPKPDPELIKLRKEFGYKDHKSYKQLLKEKAQKSKDYQFYYNKLYGGKIYSNSE